MRQPHAASSSGGSAIVMTMNSAADRIEPTGEPSCGIAA